jgi:two-component system NtrC family sensor kinase
MKRCHHVHVRRAASAAPGIRLRSALLTEQQRTEALLERIAQLESQVAAMQPARMSTATDRLSALFALSSALLMTRDLQAILDAIVHESLALFPGTGGTLLFLLDEDGALELQAASQGRVGTLSFAPGESLAGRALIAPRSMLMVGPELEMAIEEMSAEQMQKLRAHVAIWPLTSALVAPIRHEQQRLGALMLCGGTHAHLLHPRDLPFVQALADLAAVAIGNQRATERAARLQRDLTTTRTLHAEARAKLDTAQAQLLQSAKLAAVGELAASIAHEINNPLYAARNSLYLVAQDLPENGTQRQFLTIAQDELARIGKIIERMRDFYRPSRQELALTDLGHLIAETIDLVQTHLRHGNVRVELRLAPALPPVVAHADQLRQVFLNLILNACDAMPQGGTLTITSAMLPSDDEGPARVQVEIEDTGEGVPADHLPHLFEPFYTTKPQGTGLGLAISAHIITHHGGTIKVDSKLGEGTVFTVALPLQALETPMEPAA